MEPHPIEQLGSLFLWGKITDQAAKNEVLNDDAAKK
jgi:hypothetical protein